MSLETTLLILSILGGLITLRTFIKDWRDEPQKKALENAHVSIRLEAIESASASSSIRIAQLEKERVDGIILGRQVADLSEDVRDIQKKIDNLSAILMRHMGSLTRETNYG